MTDTVIICARSVIVTTILFDIAPAYRGNGRGKCICTFSYLCAVTRSSLGFGIFWPTACD
jgi:hypothetical protein